MTASSSRGLLHLAAAVDQPSVYAAAAYTEQVRLAERGGLDFVTLGDGFGCPGPDALAVLARVAPETGRIGLVPVVTTTHTEPFHVQTAVATLDWVSRGRAGWWLDVSSGEDEARLFGRRPAAGADALWREAGEVADVAARLWDSWADGGGPPDAAPGRPGARGGRHRVDFTGATFSVRGPSVLPRPPQGHPVRVVDATERPARQTAARYADVALVRAADGARAAAVRAELRSAAARYGRDPDTLRILASLVVDLGGGEPAVAAGWGSTLPGRDRETGRRAGTGPGADARGPLYRGGPVDLARLIAAWHAESTVDGFHLVPAEPHRDLERLVNGTVVLLQHHGLFRTFYPGSTLREHLGLARPANRYEAAGGGS
ncbi:LLM class flavin-dependent oxidoreductase [Streptomyces sp. MMS24-I2-30]|uniref:LLM class flavin-dependent oxidoreductase n=1 Tax=Streptomyces sp. MMS24-I2-30 TaxID=3351564 RepID=UPI003896C530